jgi:drug/metabolite transporter (DMT)-like permease
MATLFERRPDLGPSLGLGVAALLWGLFWLPLRSIGEAGLTGTWPGLLIYLIATAVLLPAAAPRGRRLLAAAPRLAVTGLFTGAAFALYSTSLLLTDVVHVLLLFYLTPLWSTLLGVAALGERVTVNRIAALALGIGGLMVVLGVDRGYPLPRNLGDWLALASGMAWAYGSLRLFRESDMAVVGQLLAFVMGALAVSAVIAAVPLVAPQLAALEPAPPAGALAAAALPAALVAAVMLPVLYLTLEGARRLSPGRVGVLLMGEALMGVGSAAALTDELFGLREALGTVLVLGAAAAELAHPEAGRESRRVSG